MLAIMDYVVMSNIYIGAQHKKIAKIVLDAISIIFVKIMLFIGDVVELVLVDNIRVFIYNTFNTSFCKISNRHARVSSVGRMPALGAGGRGIVTLTRDHVNENV